RNAHAANAERPGADAPGDYADDQDQAHCTGCEIATPPRKAPLSRQCCRCTPGELTPLLRMIRGNPCDSYWMGRFVYLSILRRSWSAPGSPSPAAPVPPRPRMPE